MTRAKRNPGGKPEVVRLKCPKPQKASSQTTSHILAVTGKKSRRRYFVMPDSVYHFKKLDTSRYIYLLESVEGVELPGFPGIYTTGERAGRRYIFFRKAITTQFKCGFSYYLELENARIFTKLRMITGEDGTARGFGDYKNAGRRDCVLVALSEDVKSLDIAFVFGRANKAWETFRAWVEELERA